MAIRFQRRIRIAPGVNVNFSRSGLGLSVGPRGFSFSAGPGGVYRNIGLPGTGLSHREKIGGGRRSRSDRQRSESTVQVSVEIDSDGQMQFRLPEGAPAPQALIRRVRESEPQLIDQLISNAVEKLNQELQACLAVHLSTPAPVYQPLEVLSELPEEPAKPILNVPGFWDRLFLRTRKIGEENALLLQRYDDAMEEWRDAVRAFDTFAAEVKELNIRVQAGDVDAQSKALESRFGDVVWAKPTDILFDFGDDATTISLDIDLPSLEELPAREALPPARGVNIRWRQRSSAQMRRDFCYLSHATLFRVAGEVFAALPRVRQVTVSGFTQQLDPSKGRVSEFYILSARIERSGWETINFSNLDAIDVQAALECFHLIRDMTRGNELRAITPLP